MKRSSELFKETKTAKEKEKSAKRSVNLIAQDTSPTTPRRRTLNDRENLTRAHRS